MDDIKKDAKETYKGLHESTQTFPGIGCQKAVSGNIVLRGRNGQRDVIIKLEDAVEKYFHTMEMVHRYALYGVRGWDTLKDIADDLKARILEAAHQRRELQIPVPESVNKLSAVL